MLTGNKSLPADRPPPSAGNAQNADPEILLIPALESRTRSNPPYTIPHCLYFGISSKSEDSPCNSPFIIRNTRQHNRCQPCTHHAIRQFLPVLSHRHPTAFPKRSPRHPAIHTANPLTSTPHNKPQITNPRPGKKSPHPKPVTHTHTAHNTHTRGLPSAARLHAGTSEAKGRCSGWKARATQSHTGEPSTEVPGCAAGMPPMSERLQNPHPRTPVRGSPNRIPKTEYRKLNTEN